VVRSSAYPAVGMEEALNRETVRGVEMAATNRFCSLIPGPAVNWFLLLVPWLTVLSAVGTLPPHHGVGWC